MATEEDVARHRRAIGVPRQEQVVRDEVRRPHPSRGGSRGYPLSERQRMLESWEDGLPVPTSMLRSIKRWSQRILPYRMTGNKSSPQGLNGHHRLLLVLVKLAYPEAKASEAAVFIATNSNDGAVFTEREISDALRDLEYSRKRLSTVASQAFTEENLQKHYVFWNEPYPAGVLGEPRRFFIDVDECGLVLDDANPHYGHAVRGLRVRRPGNYGRGLVKITVILAVEPGDPALPAHVNGSVEWPRMWARVSTDVGTTADTYKAFLEQDVMDTFPPHEPQRHFLHDNLTSHKRPDVVEAVYRRGHKLTCRPPYRPHDGPIEWVFDQLACAVRDRWGEISDEQELIW